MMHQVEHFRFASVDGLKLLQMRYDAEGFDMTLLLPDEIDGLDGVERRLSPEALKGWLAQLGPRKVAVWLPRFEIRPQALRLRDALEALGMPLAFDRNAADFTGIASAEPAERRLYLGDMLHQAFVKVDEAGTEAAAATVSIVALLGSPPPMAEFRADHPFLFLLRHAPSGAILFMGRMSDPMPTVHARPSGAVGSAPPPVPPLRPRSLLDYLRGP